MDLILDTDGDLLIENGELSLNEELEAIRQHLQVKLRFFYGEWFLDTTQGVPYFQTILVKNPNLVALNSIFKEQILSTPGVKELLSFLIEFDSALRTLTITFKVNTDFGELDFNEEIEPVAA